MGEFEFEPCAIPGCESSACVAWQAEHRGVDYNGEDALFPIYRMQCASGHWYTKTGEGIHDPQVSDDRMEAFERDYHQA